MDYDGDMTTVKGVYSEESNKELQEFMNSKSFYISLGAQNVRSLEAEGKQSLYSLTKVLPGDTNTLTDPVF